MLLVDDATFLSPSITCQCTIQTNTSLKKKKGEKLKKWTNTNNNNYDNNNNKLTTIEKTKNRKYFKDKENIQEEAIRKRNSHMNQPGKGVNAKNLTISI